MELEQRLETRRVSDVSERIHENYRGFSLQEEPSAFLDASILGHHCNRFIWLTFHWFGFYQTILDGREELVKAREKREKEYIIHNLREIGLNPTYTELDEQKPIDLGCHMRAMPDGYLPQGTGKNESTSPHSLLMQTCDTDKFISLYRDGLQKTDSQTYCQIQLEMYAFRHVMKMPCDRALYYAVCPNDDRIYTERIAYDKDDVEALLERGRYLVNEINLPDMASCHDCKDCPFREFCYHELNEVMYPEVNCRTCCHSTPKEDGTWYCERWEDTIPSLTAQHHACDSHCIHPNLVPWKLNPDACTDWSASYGILNIGEVLNGEDGDSTVSIMRMVLKKEGRTDEYLDTKYHLETLSDPNDVIPF